MRRDQFKQYSNTENLKSLVDRTLAGKTSAYEVRTPHGVVFRDIREFQGNFEGQNWNKLLSPKTISSVIRGLESSHYRRFGLPEPTSQMHYMLTCFYNYEGKFFKLDEKRQIWGMTNHPLEEGPFNVAHNVVYHLSPGKQDKVVIGIDYAPTGYLTDLDNIKTTKLARKFMNLVLGNVGAHLTLTSMKNKSLIERIPLVQIKGPDSISQDWDFSRNSRYIGKYVLMNGAGKNYLFSASAYLKDNPSTLDARDLEAHFLNSAKAKGIVRPENLFKFYDSGKISLSGQDSILRSDNSLFSVDRENIAKDLLKGYLFEKFGQVRYF